MGILRRESLLGGGASCTDRHRRLYALRIRPLLARPVHRFPHQSHLAGAIHHTHHRRHLFRTPDAGRRISARGRHSGCGTLLRSPLCGRTGRPLGTAAVPDGHRTDNPRNFRHSRLRSSRHTRYRRHDYGTGFRTDRHRIASLRTDRGAFPYRSCSAPS